MFSIIQNKSEQTLIAVRRKKRSHYQKRINLWHKQVWGEQWKQNFYVWDIIPVKNYDNGELKSIYSNLTHTQKKCPNWELWVNNKYYPHGYYHYFLRSS